MLNLRAHEVTTGFERVEMQIDRNCGTEVENVRGVVDRLNRKPMWIRRKVDVCSAAPFHYLSVDYFLSYSHATVCV
jgi:hypothetical protein